MRHAALALLVTLLLLPAGIAQQEALTVSFHSPAQIGSHVHAENATWLYVSFEAGPQNRLSVDFPREIAFDNVTEVLPLEGHGPILEGPSPGFPASVPSTLPPFSADIAFPADVASLYIEGDAIQFDVTSARGELMRPAGCLYELQNAPERHRREARSAALCPPEGDVGAVLRATEGPLAFTVTARGLRIVEWHHASVSCIPSTACPDGGVREEWTTPAGPQTITFAVHGFNHLESQDAALDGSGEARFIAAGAPVLDLAVDGWARLPLAQRASGCEACAAPDNQTLFVEGNLMLRDLSASPDGTMSASLEGDIEMVRFDEKAIDPALLTGSAAVAVAAAAGVAAVIVKFLLWPLFTRHTEATVLEHDRRRRLYDFVVKNPGVHFREALRNVGIPSGAGRYHINCLVRSGLLTERRIGSKVRLFEGGKPVREGWQDMAALRNPNLRLLHDWILNNPERSQKDILGAFLESHGWNASTTQGRLARLVRDGIVRAKAKGRRRHYAVAKQAAELQIAQMAAAPVPA